MKGLIRNTFYSMENNIKLAFLMAGFLILTPLITREPVVLSMITAVQIFIFIANVGTSLQADEISNWNRFELTLPVNVKSVILAKYISFCILIFFGFAVSLLTGLISGCNCSVIEHNFVDLGVSVRSDTIHYSGRDNVSCHAENRHRKK